VNPWIGHQANETKIEAMYERARVARELATLFDARGKPQMVVSDNGNRVHLERDPEVRG